MSKKITKKHNLQLDREFASLVPSRCGAELRQLRDNLAAHGCLEPLVVWRGAGKAGRNVLVGDYEIYRICKAKRMPFRLKRMNFQDRDEAKEFLIDMALGRANLNTYQKCLLALRWEPILRKRGKENMRLSPGRGKKGFRRPGKPFSPFRTDEILAQKVGVCGDTISKMKRLQKKASLSLKKRLEEGKSSIHGACRLIDAKQKAERRSRVINRKVHYKNPTLSKTVENVIICSDVIKGMKKIPTETVDLIVTSPPYANMKNYGRGKKADGMRYEEWLNWLRPVWTECERILVSGGRLCVNVDSVVNRHPDDLAKERKRPVFCDLVNQMRTIGEFRYRDRILWVKNNVQGNQAWCGTYCSPSNPHIKHISEDILVWSKGDYELPPPKEGITGDISDAEFREFTLNTWHIPAYLRNPAGHPCVYPEELVRRLVLLYSYPTSLVLDIFNGSGTTTAVAAQLGRRYIGIDQSKAYCAYAKKRISKVKSQILRKSPSELDRRYQVA